MMVNTISQMKCSNCDRPLNDFERSKVIKLDMYWGGRRKIDPKCVNCYYKEFEQRAVAGTSEPKP